MMARHLCYYCWVWKKARVKKKKKKKEEFKLWRKCFKNCKHWGNESLRQIIHKSRFIWVSEFKWWWLKKKESGVERGERKLGRTLSFLHWIDNCTANAGVWTRSLKKKKSTDSFKYPDLCISHLELLALSHKHFKSFKSLTKPFLRRKLLHYRTYRAWIRLSLRFIPAQESTALLMDHEASQMNIFHSSYCSFPFQFKAIITPLL